ncbi:hypothetical protein EV174_002948 [Coemansia sp. RSA 2320]|nr:hypothetical protein EV174_002948 [Coemansia sp. RSA 2320]
MSASDHSSIPSVDSFASDDQIEVAPIDADVSVSALRLVKSAEVAVEIEPHPQRDQILSMPNVKLHLHSVTSKQRGYVDLYAESYSDSEASLADEDAGDQGESSPIEAVVLKFERSTPRLPALRVGAARLGEMVYAHRRVNFKQEEADSSGFDDNESIENPDHFPVKCGVTIKSTRKPRAATAAAAIEPEEDRPPQSLTRAVSRRQPAEQPDNLTTSCAPSVTSGKAYSAFSLNLVESAIARGMQEDEEFNGLLAPGAYADEKQRAKADGTRLQRLAHAWKGDRQERESKLFKPVVFDPARKRTPGRFVPGTDTFDLDDDTEKAIMSKFPFCCCAARYCVAVGFVAVLVAAILGFFVWPRVPSISISSLSALEPAKVTYDEAGSLFGLHMPLRINYEIHSGNFYPLQISRVHVTGFDGVTGNKIIDTTLSHIKVAPQRLQFHSESTSLRYLTSDMADPALTDLFGKCAPKSARVPGRGIEGSPGALTIRFQLRVDVSNLGWLKQPIVTLNQNVECPE